MSQEMKYNGAIAAVVQWENLEKKKMESQKNEFPWSFGRSISVPGNRGVDDHCNVRERSSAYDVAPSTSSPTRKRSSILVGKRSMQLFEEFGEEESQFVKFIISAYSKWGFWISRFAWPAMIICLLISAVSLVKIIRTPQRNDLEGYAPFEARSRTEYDKYRNFFSGHGLAIATYLYVTAKDGNSMLRLTHLNETRKVLNLAINNITLYDPITQQNQSFSQFCKEFCDINEPVLQFHNAFMIQKGNLDNGDKLNPLLKLAYPTSNIFSHEFTLQPFFFGVELYNGSEAKKEMNEETEGTREFLENGTDTTEPLVVGNGTHQMITNMKSVKMIAFQFRALQSPQWSKDEMKQWEMDVVRFFEYSILFLRHRILLKIHQQ